MIELLSALKEASRGKVEAQLAGTMAAFTRTRKAIADYEQALQEDATSEIVNVALLAIGQPPLERTSPTNRLNGLRSTLRDLMTFLGPDEEPVRPAYESVPRISDHVLASLASPRASLPKKLEPTPLDIEKGWALVAEVEGTSFEAEHAIRLGYLFQAWAAEARILMGRFSPGHEVHEALGERVIRRVTNLKKEFNVPSYIRGLAFGAEDNWFRVAGDARKRLARFDRDVSAAELPPTAGNGKSAPKPEKVVAPVSYTWPDLKLLRSRMDEGWPLLVVGGRSKDRVKDVTIHERYGVTVKWCDIDPGSVRSLESISERIAVGKVAGVLLVESFLSHKAYRKIMKAGEQSPHIPIVLTGKGGVGAIGTALGDMERRLAIGMFKIPLVGAQITSNSLPLEDS